MKWEVPGALLRTRDVVRELVTWWTGELREIGGLLLRHLPSRQTPTAFLHVRADVLSLRQFDGTAWKTIAEVPAPGGNLPAELSGLPAELAGARAAIVIDESELLFCEFELPLAAERQMSAVLRLQLERALPLPLEQLLFDRQVISRDRDRELLGVRVAVVRRERVDALRELVARAGLVPVAAGPETNGAPGYNFLVRRRDPLRWRPSSLDRRLLQATAAGLAALLVVLGAQWWHERSQVGAQAAELHAQALRISAERERLVRESTPLVALQKIVATRDAAAVLANLSRSMPLSAWFNYVEISVHQRDKGRLRLIGTTASREEALAAVRAFPGVSNLQTSTSFNGQILGPENVELTADLDAAATKAAGT